MIRHNILTNDDVRDKFIEGCRALKAEPLGADGLSAYDYFPWWHHRAMMVETPPGNPWVRNAAHQGPVFSPWHRLFLLVFEAQLRRVVGDPDFRIPYWNWGADSPGTPPPVWSPEVLGGTGDPVSTGPFRSDQFRVRLTQDGNSNNLVQVDRGLRRRVGFLASGTASNEEARERVAENPIYATFPWNDSPQNQGFRWQLEIGLHNIVHRFVGGDMMTSTSPNDPVFFLHHANIDRIWVAWQRTHPSLLYLPGQTASQDLRMHRIDDRMHSFLDQEVTPRMMLDHTPHYEYDTISDVLP